MLGVGSAAYWRGVCFWKSSETLARVDCPVPTQLRVEAGASQLLSQGVTLSLKVRSC